MRKNQVKGIMYDFLDYRSYMNPTNNVWLKNKLEINLKNSNIKYIGERDSISEFFKGKRKWFLSRIRKLGGKVTDFEEVKLIVFGAKEKLTIKYKGSSFKGERLVTPLGKGTYVQKINLVKLK
ncbi:MAG: hypothetical protein ABIH49_01250 [archaeon]